MNPKPGWKTTEFWAVVATFLAAGLGAVGDKVPSEYAAAAIGLSTGLYALARGLAKRPVAALPASDPPSPPSTP